MPTITARKMGMFSYRVILGNREARQYYSPEEKPKELVFLVFCVSGFFGVLLTLLDKFLPCLCYLIPLTGLASLPLLCYSDCCNLEAKLPLLISS